MDIEPQGIGIFTLDWTGCGRGAVLNVAPDGSVSVNSPENSVSPGGTITVFATGLGWAFDLPPDGEPAPFEPLVNTPSHPGVVVMGRDNLAFGLWSGKAPGLVGVDQVNAVLRENEWPDGPAFPEGCSVPLQIQGLAIGQAISQPIALSVRKGGGVCQHPPRGRLAWLRWKRTVYSGNSPPPPRDQLEVEFTEAVNNRFPEVTLAAIGGCAGQLYRPPPGPTCPGFAKRALNAGNLILDGPGFHLAVEPRLVNGQPEYDIELPSGSTREGSFMVSAAGGPDIGPFQTRLIIPAPIELSTSSPPGTGLPPCSPWSVSWTGGDASGRVSARIIGRARAEWVVECAAQASEGTLEIPAGRPACLFDSPSAELVIIHSPSERGQVFNAQGLTMGGLHTWTYEFRFADLTIP